MKFLLIDDHELFLDGLTQVINYQIENVEVLKANTVEAALKLVFEHPDIDLALVDLAMPKSDGIKFIKQITSMEILIPIAVLSASNDIQQIQQVITAGALGFIPKTHSSEALINAIECILNGKIYLPTSLEKQLIQHQQQAHTSLEIAASYDVTSRQIEVLILLAQGLSNNKIADALFISEHTVKSHIKQLYQKLQVDSRISCINQAKNLSILASD